eukprot:scaffold2200_cov413-Prasinococcus_capsulatus_cf.AAC.20
MLEAGGSSPEGPRHVRWGLDPVYKTVARVLVRDLVECHEVQGARGYFRLGQHIVQRMEIMGYVVAVLTKHNRVEFTVDDGTGCMPCCYFLSQLDEAPSQQLGTHVVVRYAARAGCDSCSKASIRRWALLHATDRQTSKGPTHTVAEQASLGALLRVQGKLITFRGVRQLKCSAYRKYSITGAWQTQPPSPSNLCLRTAESVADCNAEMLHWLDSIKLMNELYSQQVAYEQCPSA